MIKISLGIIKTHQECTTLSQSDFLLSSNKHQGQKDNKHPEDGMGQFREAGLSETEDSEDALSPHPFFSRSHLRDFGEGSAVSLNTIMFTLCTLSWGQQSP